MRDTTELAERAVAAQRLLEHEVVAEVLAAIERDAFEQMLRADPTSDMGRSVVSAMRQRVLFGRAFKDELNQAISRAGIARRQPPAVA